MYVACIDWISHPWIGFCIWVVSYVPLGSLDALVQGMEGGEERRQRQWSFSSGGSGHNPAPNSPHRQTSQTAPPRCLQDWR